MNPTGVLETVKATNPLLDLQKFGQSIWLDYIRRNLITSGELQRLIDEDGLRGITSNPSIFEKAISGSTDYADLLQSFVRVQTWTPRPATKFSRFATSRTPPTFSAPCTRARIVATG